MCCIRATSHLGVSVSDLRAFELPLVMLDAWCLYYISKPRAVTADSMDASMPAPASQKARDLTRTNLGQQCYFAMQGQTLAACSAGAAGTAPYLQYALTEDDHLVVTGGFQGPERQGQLRRPRLKLPKAWGALQVIHRTPCVTSYSC